MTQSRPSHKSKEEVLRKKLVRQTRAREEAEDLLESKALALYQANQSLQESIRQATNDSARLAAIMNSITDCVLATDRSFTILDANRFCVKVPGVSYQELLGQNLLNFVNEAQLADFKDCCAAVLETEGDDLCEFIFHQGDGPEFPAEVKISLFRHDEEAFFLFLIRDISKRKEMEQEREKMEKELASAAKWEAVGQLAGGIAHEINTPAQYIGDNLFFLKECTDQLFEILNAMMLLKLQCQKEGRHSDLIQKIDELIEEHDLQYLNEEIPLALDQSRDGIAQVSKIVLAMKDFSHPGTQEKEPFDLNQAIETTLTVSRNEWKNVATIDLDLDDEIGLLSCIPGAMNQVLLNIVINAAHAIEKKHLDDFGLIKIKTFKGGGDIVISISDNGVGIKEEDRDNIFNPFFTTKEIGKGTGQGLSIVKDIVVAKHNGDITVESEVGVGTTFTVTLPMKEMI